ncbi:iron-containing redox enzyme family protein [Actinorugispora endophytica]|uniref:Heme oxygenase-like protein n=1 Tax=Actinorugispora endophytica TaxID=1605990 RepID=A0A4R6V2G8_9ACTN|nr:iron-containing redox enzyme family protein [Actinorugispora endophytica]TDQ54230.1 heme oxygenase-like protein [Actinorugispora endophytica]
MRLPRSRGPVTERLFEALARPPRDGAPRIPDPDSPGVAALADEDLQLALHVCYELHYCGFDGVDDAWEWDPGLLAARAALEARFEGALGALVAGSAPEGFESAAPPGVPAALAALVRADGGGPSLAAFLRRHADLGHYREFAVHRSVYHLREADPHTWGIPRIRGRAKAALVEIQSDEYGEGNPDRMHSALFAAAMRGLGLDDGYGAYLDAVPGVTLAVSNTMSFFGLHRRRRGALLGHLAAFEMTSTGPNRDISLGLRRLGAEDRVRRYFDEHVEADAVHEQIAAHDMCGAFAADHPELAADVLFGAAACLAVDRLFAGHVIDRWKRGATSLRPLRSLAPV